MNDDYTYDYDEIDSHQSGELEENTAIVVILLFGLVMFAMFAVAVVTLAAQKILEAGG